MSGFFMLAHLQTVLTGYITVELKRFRDIRRWQGLSVHKH